MFSTGSCVLNSLFLQKQGIAAQALVKRHLIRAKIALIGVSEAKNADFPCKFPVNRALGADWIAGDCAHSQTLLTFQLARDCPGIATSFLLLGTSSFRQRPERERRSGQFQAAVSVCNSDGTSLAYLVRS